MALKVIGAGFGRTGTLSLKLALEKLGFDKCYHMMEVFEHRDHLSQWSKLQAGQTIDFDQLFEGYQASVDWPSCNFWREQLANYPDARVILSTRDPERWYDSVMNTIYPSSSAAAAAEDPVRASFGKWSHEIIWDAVFDGRMADREHVINVFVKHNEAVRKEVPADRLLEFEAAEGWEPLCEFLGAPVPAEPYPRVNTTEEFNARIQAAGDSE